MMNICVLKNMKFQYRETEYDLWPAWDRQQEYTQAGSTSTCIGRNYSGDTVIVWFVVITAMDISFDIFTE
jgi:hypothetical protein